MSEGGRESGESGEREVGGESGEGGEGGEIEGEWKRQSNECKSQ